ncbi:MAG: hypothetical protein HQL72_06595 [Magnetococcales bacterium]|nr:hypothetical protein [Magnetococcales bacterium]
MPKGISSPVATLVISQNGPLKRWLDHLHTILPAQVERHFFFVDTGVALIGEQVAGHLPLKGFYCAHSHRLHQGPAPLAGMVSGGLLDLGRMVAKSHATLSLPHTLLPLHYVSDRRSKKIALLLRQNVEGLRVATGLAGCGHQVTLFHAEPLSSLPEEAEPYLQTLTALNARFLPPPSSYTNSRFDLLLAI